MTLPSSGSISLTDIATEFSATLPKSLTDFYKGGTYVQNNAINAAVPTSGSISLTNFYGASAADILPNAVNWTDVAGTTANLTTITQTITSISVGINLKVDYTQGVNGITYQYKLNAGAFTAFTSGDLIAVVNNDVLSFRGTRGAPGADAGTISVYNNTNGNSIIDGINFTWS